MEKDFEIEINTMNSVYGEKRNCYERKLKIYFSIPENGVNENTGLFTYVYGISGNAKGNMCKKMRREFADKYNLVTMQCDYFGYEFLGLDDEFTFENKNILTEQELNDFKANKMSFIRGLQRPIEIYGKPNLKESIESFNEMGMMQALDVIITNLTVMNILYENGYTFNAGKNILYGSSHGGYLSHLANKMSDGLFTMIIDNSGWKIPRYLFEVRRAWKKIGKFKVFLDYDYMAKKNRKNIFMFDLEKIYKNKNNGCNIKIYHGSNDRLAKCEEKYKAFKDVENVQFYKITEEEIDNDIFKSTNHCMDADYFKLFALAMERVEFNKSKVFKLPEEVHIESSLGMIKIDYKNILPTVFMVN
ncbi:MAG: DUF2920 family protein [Sarcina sp.]